MRSTADNSARSHVGYNGQLHEAATRWQILGNGYRVYSPALRRYYSADSLSPFEEGGLNAYAYGTGNPVNVLDPSGHWGVPALAGVLTAGALAVGGVAVASTLKGNDSHGDVLGAVAGVLAAGAAAAGLLFLHMRDPGPKRGELIVRNGKSKDVVLAHGDPNLTLVGTSDLDGSEFSELLKQKGVGDKPIQLVSCRSATGPAPQGQVVANATGQPVTAYRGVVVYSGIVGKAFGRKVRFRPQTGLQKEVTAIRNRELNRHLYGQR